MSERITPARRLAEDASAVVLLVWRLAVREDRHDPRLGGQFLTLWVAPYVLAHVTAVVAEPNVLAASFKPARRRRAARRARSCGHSVGGRFYALRAGFQASGPPQLLGRRSWVMAGATW
jgi:hypothetical protein